MLLQVNLKWVGFHGFKLPIIINDEEELLSLAVTQTREPQKNEDFLNAICDNKLTSKEQMKLEIFQYIQMWYNKKTRYSTLNYQTIQEFNNQTNFYNNVT